MTDADCLLYASEEDIDICPGDDDFYWFMPDSIESDDDEILPTDKDNQRATFERRKSFHNSKLRDHKRFGKCGSVGGNPRYSDSKSYWRKLSSRKIDRVEFAAAIADNYLQKLEAEREACDEMYDIMYEETSMYDEFWDKYNDFRDIDDNFNWRDDYDREYWEAVLHDIAV